MKSLMDITLLVVEDEPILKTVMEKTLKYRFREVFSASNVADALELYEKHCPKVVLTDIVMPGQDGLELTRILKERDPMAIVIAITAHSEPEMLQKGVEAGLDHYLIKPSNAQEIVDAILQVVENYQEKHGARLND